MVRTAPAVSAALMEAKQAQDEEPSLAKLQKERGKWEKDESKKAAIRDFQRRVRWHKHHNEWSSAAEPDLSPIMSLRSGRSGQSTVSLVLDRIVN